MEAMQAYVTRGRFWFGVVLVVVGIALTAWRISAGAPDVRVVISIAWIGFGVLQFVRVHRAIHAPPEYPGYPRT